MWLGNDKGLRPDFDELFRSNQFMDVFLEKKIC